jgi:hypothetical protein
MDNIKKIIEIENYEIIGKASNILITYSLSDCTELLDIEHGSIIIKEKNSDNHDLIVTTDLGDYLVIFKNLNSQTAESLHRKTIVFAGVSEKTNDIEEALLVSKITIENKTKKKLEQ